MTYYLRVWAASARYSITRAMMFRGDLLVWSLVELFWMGVNLLTIDVIYRHTDSVAGWSKHEMMLLVGTSMLIQRFLMGFFWSSLFEMGRNVRTGNFDFTLAQPGNVLFMASTRKLDLDGLMNSAIAAGVVIYSVRQLGLHPGPADVALYAFFVLCGIVIHYSVLVLSNRPSVVSAAEDGTIYVGREAQRRLLTDPARTVYSVKRFMGKGAGDVSDEASLLPFRVGGDSGGGGRGVRLRGI